ILLHSVFTQLSSSDFWDFSFSRISFTSAEQLDSIQRLFLDKLREYSTKSQASGGPVDAGPEYEKALSEELTKLQRLYGSGVLTKFPEFKFSGGCIFAFTLFELPHFCCTFRMIIKLTFFLSSSSFSEPVLDESSSK
uniref:ATP synthase peripheral stalk subunit F6, mitochondrial n=1 Tax=Sinocyclocheilus rhinocerous TaxID=307959 RepID=A0A673GD74_9TELE